ncbi:inosine-uridine preferring nucleoside hydrolase [Fictibacillus macauensis ZFHKF-1]|uniref:Inosine-uridine preferring nucleoside hydrolase n=1 Tax=Fictibacillus macauensis ZFHKF-1 TaxID=1196324 RepID=I8AKW9_9BACL|nr:nucleoside hydrolase [Fictibacillus macauensis]EIT86477.1 inosine-uridine preferring nucleoside hydrolase [Fictibacillus macauensis ZFHKF-1]
MGKKVLLFADVGIDDTIALIYASLSKEVDIVGIVADYGNVPRKMGLRNITYLTRLFPFSPDTKVILGAEKPMTGENPVFYPEIHGEQGLGYLTPPEDLSPNGYSENFYEVVSIINKYAGELTIVNTGRLTSLASMYILFNDLMDQVNEVYVMGGAFWVPGNVTAVSEANFNGDPIAAKIVFRYAKNLTIIPLNVTEHAIVTPQMVDYIQSKGKAKIIKPLLDFYYQFYKRRNPSIVGSPVHDALTLIAAINNSMFSFGTYPVYMDINSGVTKGQSIADLRPSPSMTNSERRHRIAFSFDYPLFYHDFMSIMTGETV